MNVLASVLIQMSSSEKKEVKSDSPVSDKQSYFDVKVYYRTMKEDYFDIIEDKLNKTLSKLDTQKGQNAGEEVIQKIDYIV